MGEYFSDPFQVVLWALVGIAGPITLLSFLGLFFWMMWENELAPAVKKDQVADRLGDLGGYRVSWTYEGIEFVFGHRLPALPQCRLTTERAPGPVGRPRTGVRDVDLTLIDRTINQSTLDNVWANRARLNPAAKLLARHGRKFPEIVVQNDRISFTFTKSVGPNVFERLFKQMLEAAQSVHAAFGFHPLRAERPSFEPRAADGVGYRRAGAVSEQDWMVENIWAAPSGPLSTTAVVDLLYRGRLSPISRVALAGSQAWAPIGTLEDFRAAFASPPKAPAGARKSRRPSTELWMRRFRRVVRHAVAPLVAAALTTAGAAILAGGKVTQDRAIESLRWPSTDGRIVESRVVRKTSGSGSDRKTSYSLKLRYRFTVRGHGYEGGRPWFGLIGSSYQEKQAVTRRYPVGKAVTVYYRSTDPTVSVLERGAAKTEATWPAFLLLFPGFLLLLTVGAFRAWFVVERWAVRR